jgi:hypothetical protein
MKRLADAFLVGVDQTKTKKVQSMIDTAARRIHSEFDRLPVEVRFTDRDLYKSAIEMRDQVLSTGVLYIWKGASDVPMWDPLTNWKARAVHDWQHISDQFDFTMGGEYEGFRAAARRMPQLAPIYLSEIAMQAAVANVYGDFAAQQKIVLLDPGTEAWATSLRGLRGAPGDAADAIQLTAVMLSVMKPEDVVALLAVMDASQEDAIALVEGAQIYDAMLEGQLSA